MTAIDSNKVSRAVFLSLPGNLSNLLPLPQRFPPLAEACMPLQPRRTWSAEDERRRRLEEDPDAYDVGPHTVTCAGCHRPIRLNATGRYYAANWNKHKMGCKNTNAANGASAVSAVRITDMWLRVRDSYVYHI